MQLSKRLSAVAEFVTPGGCLVDVGTDHGYVPIALLEQQKISSAIAMDVNRGPLERAREHIAQYQMGDYIETRLSDGLKEIGKEEGDTLVIAGMGGPLMEKILTEGEETRKGFRELILQPQSDIPHVRKFLFENGYHIVNEEMVLEEGKFYPLMKAVPGKADREWTEEELEFGKFLLEKCHPVLRQYLERELRIRKEILERLKDAPGASAGQRRQEVEEEKRKILTALRRYEG